MILKGLGGSSSPGIERSIQPSCKGAYGFLPREPRLPVREPRLSLREQGALGCGMGPLKALIRPFQAPL